jgi:hypothetical protein
MSYEDRTLTCQDCGQEFTFSADDQQYHAEKGYTNEPKRHLSRHSGPAAETAADKQQRTAQMYLGYVRSGAACQTQVPVFLSGVRLSLLQRPSQQRARFSMGPPSQRHVNSGA